MELNFPQECRVVGHGTIKIPEGGVLLFSDPEYANEEHDWLGGIALTEWVGEVPLYTIVDDQGNRAIVLTDGSDIPAPLLKTKLTGTHVFQGSVGVDTGTIGIYSMNYAPLIHEPFGTWIGDGMYPVAFFGRNGYVYAVAVLCDLRYYAKG